jgi:pimeloyl-ACP methyl ester carboxylesterase
MTSTPRAAAREWTIDSAGVPITLTEFPNPGQPPVLLLHGIGSRGSSWWPVIDPLAERFHLYQLDLRGHGGSGKPERGYVIDDYVADLDAVLDALALDEPRIMGHSLGGLIALFWASEHPTRATAIVLEDPPLHTEPEVLGAFDGWQQLAALTPAQAAAWYRQEYPHWSDEDCVRRAEAITSTAPAVFADLRAATEEALANGTGDRTHVLTGIQTPMLLLRGNPELGAMVDPRDAARFTQIIPRGEVAYIATAGHNLHRDATAQFLDVVIPFLEYQPKLIADSR